MFINSLNQCLLYLYLNTEKVFCIILYIKYTVDQVYLYLAMYRVFVFVIGILVLVFDPCLDYIHMNNEGGSSSVLLL